MLAAGIDAGSSRWAVALLRDGKLTGYTEMASGEAERIASLVSRADVVAAPSGYGLPLMHISQLTARELRLLAFKRERESILGLTALLRELKRRKLNAFILPGAKHLPTVPAWRKINRIDMGTPDKVAACACAIATLARERKIRFDEMTFLFAELGSFFNAFLAVEDGKIVDGIGGSCASMGWRARGAVDAEVVGGMKRWAGKRFVFSGGLADARKVCRDAENAYWEGVLKDLARLRVAVDAREVVLSGALASRAKERLEMVGAGYAFFDLQAHWGGRKPAAIGAAMLADGIAGGEFHPLFDCMEIDGAAGSILDFVV
ncbi:MAG: DUF1464 family protein [Candidatus Micrarchaeia archaeon]